MLSTLALLAALHAAPAAADSVAGNWQITGDVVGNPLNVRCALTQTGTKVGGVCNMDSGKYEVTGEVKGDTITFKHGGDYQGSALTITYTGVLGKPRSMKGSVDVQPFGVSGTFTAAPAGMPVTK